MDRVSDSSPETQVVAKNFTMTDAQLLDAIREGNPHARHEFALRWAGTVLSICRSRVWDRHIAEELAQETILRAFRRISGSFTPDKPGPWLYGIAVRVCQDFHRQRTRESRALQERHVERSHACESSPLNEIVEREQSVLLNHAVAELPEEQREVLWLHYHAEMSYTEIAEFLNVARATVNTRLSQARRTLAVRLTKPDEVRG